MANLHAVAASAVAVASATETVIATMTAFNENSAVGAGSQGLAIAGGDGPQGVYLGGSINITPASATTVTVRVRKGSLTGAMVGVAQVATVGAAAVTNLDIGELDPSLIQTPAVYVVTVTTGTGTATVNRVVFTAETANSFE